MYTSANSEATFSGASLTSSEHCRRLKITVYLHSYIGVCYLALFMNASNTVIFGNWMNFGNYKVFLQKIRSYHFNLLRLYNNGPNSKIKILNNENWLFYKTFCGLIDQIEHKYIKYNSEQLCELLKTPMDQMIQLGFDHKLWNNSDKNIVSIRTNLSKCEIHLNTITDNSSFMESILSEEFLNLSSTLSIGGNNVDITWPVYIEYGTVLLLIKKEELENHKAIIEDIVKQRIFVIRLMTEAIINIYDAMNKILYYLYIYMINNTKRTVAEWKDIMVDKSETGVILTILKSMYSKVISTTEALYYIQGEPKDENMCYEFIKSGEPKDENMCYEFIKSVRLLRNKTTKHNKKDHSQVEEFTEMDHQTPNLHREYQYFIRKYKSIWRNMCTNLPSKFKIHKESLSGYNNNHFPGRLTDYFFSTVKASILSYYEEIIANNDVLIQHKSDMDKIISKNNIESKYIKHLLELNGWAVILEHYASMMNRNFPNNLNNSKKMFVEDKEFMKFLDTS